MSIEREGMLSRFLVAITDGNRPRIRERVAIVVAHPDDETLGCGSLLPQLDDVRIVHVTDGAPRNGADAWRHGFTDPAAYAAARGAELGAALALAGIPPDRATCLGVADQGVAGALSEVARRLVSVCREADIVLTHAAEGGHPDHDGTAFAVRAALRLGGRPVADHLVEMPFYRDDGQGGWLRQSFAAGGCTRSLTASERETKSRMLAAHGSQSATLNAFGAADEPFRAGQPVDFARVPNNGRALYDGFSWDVRAEDFTRLAVAAAAELGLSDACV